ncbi:hypothetical protein [Helicobacter pylori]|uniref:hypothetical protein n=1 Tax=Helicobacter pylori TaxID=210 RepID=UPI0002B9FC6B|nr:hypothetical protein [Helicobacter pylori]EMH10314.1 hypothetical protein HMPREF1411_00586 [Helicobacter pylori GAM250AFi]EMH14650.1 hypothetical protein HMPREF1413_00813 [Helicobacter pylori GAM252Bi]EMH14897.1 hypothetical protein HMPREF1412_00471 [Helicobacter pylori GAM250T]EMH15249.1 hypothetical protein HMPREF1414_00649 [Helicobacter pylori GAM252T]EMH47781.1 hypothetical protein HMPREF1438_00813 [Helicobacter pylori HP250AFii]
MCVLCGELISSFHWTDGSDENLRGSNAVISTNENARERKRVRLKRVGLLNQILAFYGLKIGDWQGAKFVLCDKKGQSVIVNDLGDLWGKAQNLAKKEMDALDSNLLAFLNQHTQATR